MHSLVGLAAVFIAIAAVDKPASVGLPAILPMGSKLELFLGTFIGAMTWSGFGHCFPEALLSGRISGAPITFGGQHMVDLIPCDCHALRSACGFSSARPPIGPHLQR